MNKEKLKIYATYIGNATVLALSLTIIVFSFEAWKTSLGLQPVHAGGGEYLIVFLISVPAFIAVNIVHGLLVYWLSSSYLHRPIRYIYRFTNVYMIGLIMVDIFQHR
jgi:hypothetical protein